MEEPIKGILTVHTGIDLVLSEGIGLSDSIIALHDGAKVVMGSENI